MSGYSQLSRRIRGTHMMFGGKWMAVHPFDSGLVLALELIEYALSNFDLDAGKHHDRNLYSLLPCLWLKQ